MSSGVPVPMVSNYRAGTPCSTLRRGVLDSQTRLCFNGGMDTNNDTNNTLRRRLAIQANAEDLAEFLAIVHDDYFDPMTEMGPDEAAIEAECDLIEGRI